MRVSKLTFIQKFEQYWSKTLNTSTSISISKYIKSKAFNANAVRVVEIPFFITLLKQTWKRKRIEWLEHKEDSKFTLLYTINRPHIYLFTKVFLEMSDSAFQTFRKSYWCTQKTDRNILTKNSIDKFSHDFYISFAFENIFSFLTYFYCSKNNGYFFRIHL